jgi:quinol monooxygenase YgiN
VIVSEIRVVARVIAKPDSVAHVRQVLVAQVGPTRKEEGCIRYDLMQNVADPTDFTFYEEWASLEALMAHSASPHLARSRPLLEGHLVLPTDVRRYTLVE